MKTYVDLTFLINKEKILKLIILSKFMCTYHGTVNTKNFIDILSTKFHGSLQILKGIYRLKSR